MNASARAACALLWLTLAMPCVAAVHTVDCAGGGDYLTIQEAVDVAAHLDTILIAPCVYEERVEIVDKVLDLRGAGSEATELRWGGDFETLLMDAQSLGYEEQNGGWISGLTIVREPQRLPAVIWRSGRLVLEDCVVDGGALTGDGWSGAVTSITVLNCDLEEVTTYGSSGICHVTDSRIGSAHFIGYSVYSGCYHPARLYSEGNEYGSLEMAITEAELTDDTVTTLEMGALGGCTAVDSWFGDVSSHCSDVRFERCTVAGLVDVWGWTDVGVYECGTLRLTDCLVEGLVRADVTFDDWVGGEGALDIVNNTIVGDLVCEYNGANRLMMETHVINNIIVGTTVIGGDAIHGQFESAIVHNDFVGGATLPTVIDSVFGNFSEDPLFCSGDYTLQECSPCVGAGLNGEDVGAFDIGCECETAVEDMTWGRVKGLFR